MGKYTIKDDRDEMAREIKVTHSRPLTQRQFERVLERRTHHYFGMTVDEFKKALRAGKLDQNLAATEIAMLLGARPR